MSRIVSVSKSHGSDNKTRNFVVMQNEDGSSVQVEVDDASAKRFKEALGNQGSQKLLTETLP